jgi:shikimate dehydrogenase
MSVGGTRLRVGLIGDPVAHSLSPAIQQPALDALGIAADYELWPTASQDLPDRIASLRTPGVLGANVTVPHKVAAMALVDVVAPPARRAGAINTVILRDGNLVGDNTDIIGFAAALGAVQPPEWREKKPSALVLGAGGAARAVVLALGAMGIGSVTIANRSDERARHLVADLAPTQLQIVVAKGAGLSATLATTDLLVNATSLGWQPGESPLDAEVLASLPPTALVVDLTYRDTDLLRAARARGLQTLDGLSMLVHQAARSFEVWTGRRAPIEIMFDAAVRAREARP